MDVEKQRVDVTVIHPPKILFACPECGIESPVFDHAEERVWRHLDSCQFFTCLHARVPRIFCATDGVRQVSVPWAETLEAFYQTLTPEQRNGIRAVSLDMWDPFFQATLRHVPEAPEKIVFDRYHIMSQVGKAVDTVRKRETRDGKNPELKGSKYLWLYSKENLPETQQDRFDALRSLNLKVGRAWAMKEDLRTLWSLPSVREARTFWKRWYWWATHSRLKPMREVVHLIKWHLSNVLTYITHPITNATSEGLNSKIQTIKKRACGFWNKERFKIAIYFHCGGLNPYPS